MQIEATQKAQAERNAKCRVWLASIKVGPSRALRSRTDGFGTPISLRTGTTRHGTASRMQLAIIVASRKSRTEDFGCFPACTHNDRSTQRTADRQRTLILHHVCIHFAWLDVFKSVPGSSFSAPGESFFHREILRTPEYM